MLPYRSPGTNGLYAPAEMKTPDGKPLPEESIHLGAGFEALFDCFSYEGYPERRQFEGGSLKHALARNLS